MLMKGWSFAFCFAFGFEITFEEISAIPWHNMTHGARFKVSRRWVPMSAWLVPVFIAWRRHERSEG